MGIFMNTDSVQPALFENALNQPNLEIQKDKPAQNSSRNSKRLKKHITSRVKFTKENAKNFELVLKELLDTEPDVEVSSKELLEQNRELLRQIFEKGHTTTTILNFLREKNIRGISVNMLKSFQKEIQTER